MRARGPGLRTSKISGEMQSRILRAQDRIIFPPLGRPRSVSGQRCAGPGRPSASDHLRSEESGAYGYGRVRASRPSSDTTIRPCIIRRPLRSPVFRRLEIVELPNDTGCFRQAGIRCTQPRRGFVSGELQGHRFTMACLPHLSDHVHRVLYRTASLSRWCSSSSNTTQGPPCLRKHERSTES